YKRNRGGGRFAPPELVATAPSPGRLQPGTQLLDVANEGRKSFVQLGGPVAGYVQRSATSDWDPFVPFASMPNIAWNDPNLRMIDLNGDGLAEVLLSEDEVFGWHASLGKDGFGPRERVPKP